MKQFLALTVCLSILSPSVALATGDETKRLILSGTETAETIRAVTHARVQNASPGSSFKDGKLWGMHWVVTLSLVAAGVGAGIGALKGIEDKDAQGNPVPGTADRQKGALAGAGLSVGILWGAMVLSVPH